jgi:hypothetical protein
LPAKRNKTGNERGTSAANLSVRRAPRIGGSVEAPDRGHEHKFRFSFQGVSPISTKAHADDTMSSLAQ